MHSLPRQAIVLTFLALLAGAAVAAESTPTPTQLPRLVRPTHYNVTIEPNAAALTFRGDVAISLEVLAPVQSITLNAIDMKFASVRFTDSTGKKVVSSEPKVTMDEAAQTATFTFDSKIPSGSYWLALDYTGKIGTQAVGLFAIDYDTAGGRKRALYTQFEAADARRMIPSWDEPAYKATFVLEAIVPQSQMAVSNMPVAERSDMAGGRARVRFQQSPKMSTYLLFFGLGEFDRATAKLGPTELGVVTQKGKADQAQFALDSSVQVLREYNDYFGMPYALPKLDNIASPGSSRFFGAMENWGAIYTFEHAMLLDPAISTQADKQSVFGVAAHEIAHQWFGDLVTMRWWDDLWLNEGFASWMASRTTKRLHPEWSEELSAVGSRDRAITRDSIATTHPIVQKVETVEQAAQAFDAISYLKGEAVLHMLEGYVGDDAWREGVRRYMKAHAYGNTVSDDLWREVEAAAGQPITAIAHDFTLQPGVPMIRVASATCQSGQTTLQLVQEEFSRDKPSKKPLAWRVPVTAKALGAKAAPVRHVVTGGKATMSVPGCDAVVVNAGQSGYYRTLYAPAQFGAIAKRFAAIPALDQLGILSDTWALGLGGQQSSTDVLTLALATPATADPQVWGKLAEVFGSLNEYYEGEGERQARLRAFAISRLAPVLERLGWTPGAGELDTVAILRTQLIDVLSELGDRKVIDEARRRYAAGDEKSVPPTLRKTILDVVARHADAKTWDRLRAEARAEKTPLVKDRLYNLLAVTEDESLAKRTLDLALTEEPGATNTPAMIAGVAVLHPELAFDFALAHMAAVNERIDASSRSSFFPALASTSHDPAMIGKVNAYAKANLAPTARRTAETAVAVITDHIRIRRDRLKAIDDWLANHS
ncbi:MAG TPA: M1 family metallopeptidase [Steroidobacteraceae bacterium]|nr:M1 family metallopeptidase [Steroidobacteraceae bacterium]